MYEPSSFETWYENLEGNRARIEATLNRLVVADIIDCEDTPETHRVLMVIAETIAKSWNSALASEFPENSTQSAMRGTHLRPAFPDAR